jgi:hypothetical protein
MVIDTLQRCLVERKPALIGLVMSDESAGKLMGV